MNSAKQQHDHSAKGPHGTHTLGETWSWVQFCFAFFFTGFLGFFLVGPLSNMWLELGAAVASATLGGILAARFGDRAWHWLAAFLRWP
jgi:hypothetical protein